jgi:hypothetical protein
MLVGVAAVKMWKSAAIDFQGLWKERETVDGVDVVEALALGPSP